MGPATTARVVVMQRQRVQLPPSDPEAVARQWLEQPPHVVFEAVNACAHRPVALPFFHAGVRWPVGDMEGRPIADLRAVAAAAAAMLPSALYARVMSVGGSVSRVAFMSATGLPSFRNALRVRRPDLFWFVAACHELVRRAPRAAHVAVAAAAKGAWVADPGTAFFTSFEAAVRAADVRCASPGGDVLFCKTLQGSGVSMAPRDKMIVLLVLLFGEDFCWVRGGAPPCSPPLICTAAAELATACDS